MPQIVWTLPARIDLRKIESWLEENGSSETALRVLVAIHKRVTFLERFPHGGRPTPHGFRVLRVFDTPYLILYRLDRGDVDVVRVTHEREDWFIEP